MKIKILGASTNAKRSSAGNSGHAPATLSLDRDGGIARLYLKVFDNEEGLKADEEGKAGAVGHAIFRLEKDEAVALIKGLTEIYNLNKEAQ
jgi:hypothetical protein